MLRELKTNKFVTLFLKKHLHHIADEFNLKLIDVRILFYIYTSEHSVIADDIVDDLFCSKAHISMSLKELEKKGYVYKTQSKEDKRKFVIHYNDKIIPIINLSNKIRDKLVSIALEGIDEEKIKIYNEVVDKSIENIKNTKIRLDYEKA